MKKTILALLAIFPMLVTIFVMKDLPETVATHYDLYGNADAWGSKYTHFLMPCIIIVDAVIWYLVSLHFKEKAERATRDKERAEALQNEKVMYLTAIGMTLFFTIEHICFMWSDIVEVREGLDHLAVDISSIMTGLSGILFIVFGNYLPKTKRNTLTGLRTKWSVSSDEVWAKSNRFAGIMLIITGLFSVAAAVFVGGIFSLVIMTSILLVSIFISVWYSHAVYKKLGGRDEDDEQDI